MPRYVYQVVREDGEEGELFEIDQSMSDPPLTEHPETGAPVQRVFQTPNLSFKHTSRHESRSLSSENVEKHGFTRYVKDKGTGTYYKDAGKAGPDILDPK